ncbi:MAG: type II toxin-antitoxin system VapC family toxin [Gammaproteobacteria bacterium]
MKPFAALDDHLLFAPDLIWAEFGNVLRKKWHQREIEADVARLILEDFRRFPLQVRSSDTLLATAWTIAEELHRAIYHSLYLALAESKGYRLVTATDTSDDPGDVPQHSAAGESVILGSRDAERARAPAAEISRVAGGTDRGRGAKNREAVAASDLVGLDGSSRSSLPCSSR